MDEAMHLPDAHGGRACTAKVAGRIRNGRAAAVDSFPGSTASKGIKAHRQHHKFTERAPRTTWAGRSVRLSMVFFFCQRQFRAVDHPSLEPRPANGTSARVHSARGGPPFPSMATPSRWPASTSGMDLRKYF